VWPLRSELCRGSPVEGMDANEDDEPSVGDRECDGVDGRCASVAIAARYCMTFLVLSVFPAPDSPLLRVSVSKVRDHE
jgi:hypothetical protein